MSSFVYKKTCFQYDSVFYYKPSVLYVGSVCERNQASLGHGALRSPSADQVNMSTVLAFHHAAISSLYHGCKNVHASCFQQHVGTT